MKPTRFCIEAASLALVLIGPFFVPVEADEEERAARVSEGKKDDNGFLVHEVRSPYQAGTTHIKVLSPDNPEKGKRYPVVFVLPVEAGNESRYGDGLKEVYQLNLHNKHRAMFVAPTFAHLPWYADHPTKAEVRQGTHFLKVVVPFVEKTYPVRDEAGGRLLQRANLRGSGDLPLAGGSRSTSCGRRHEPRQEYGQRARPRAGRPSRRGPGILAQQGSPHRPAAD